MSTSEAMDITAAQYVLISEHFLSNNNTEPNQTARLAVTIAS
jgi:hypothetical protein